MTLTSVSYEVTWRRCGPNDPSAVTSDVGVTFLSYYRLLSLDFFESLLSHVYPFSRLFSRIVLRYMSKNKFDPLPLSSWNITISKNYRFKYLTLFLPYTFLCELHCNKFIIIYFYVILVYLLFSWKDDLKHTKLLGYCMIHVLAYMRSSYIIFKLSPNYTSEEWWTYFPLWDTHIYTKS